MNDGKLLYADLTGEIFHAAIEVHKQLGPGLLESAYEICLYNELIRQGHAIERQIPLPVAYKGRQLDCGYRLDLVVENKVIVELKCVEKILPIHESQLLTYLRLARLQVGLLINFNVSKLKEGVVRKVLSNYTSSPPRSPRLRGEPSSLPE